jgi:OPT oligopeptide transporter protein
VVGWAVLSPLSKHLDWAPGPVGDMSTGARGWILWPSLAIMCADSLVSLLPIVYESIKNVAGRKIPEGDVEPEDEETETMDRLVPITWVIWGSGGAVLFGTVLVWAVFGSEGIKPWATVIGFGLGGLLSLLG